LSRSIPTTRQTLLIALLVVAAPLGAESAAPTAVTLASELAALRQQLALQQRQIEELRAALDAQRLLLEQMLPVSQQLRSAPQAAAPLPNTPAPSELAQPTLNRFSAAGFLFSGDFRYRLDLQARSSNEFAGPLQNVRSRYRLRLNVDKQLDSRFKFHMQLSTGPYNVGLTNDQDMGATVAKPPFSLAEAYIDFRPNSHFLLRGGRMEEVFADNMRFLWDDDVRFNGFHQIFTLPIGDGPLGLRTIEFRAGEYILTNPNVSVLPANSPYVSAGYQPGQKVRAANLFHPGLILKGSLDSAWNHQAVADVSLYRNPNQIQLASTSAGYPAVVCNSLGLSLAGQITGAGNATTAPGGAMYAAPRFQIVRLAYRLERKGVRVGNREMPAWLDFQAARNVGTSRLRDAVMASANLGAIRGAGDVRFLYQFAIKDANSMISQFTDDDLGTGTGVNIAVHALRFDLGITRFLQWQNLLFIQHARRADNSAERFFVLLPRGSNPTFRYLGQLAFSF